MIARLGEITPGDIQVDFDWETAPSVWQFSGHHSWRLAAEITASILASMPGSCSYTLWESAIEHKFSCLLSESEAWTLIASGQPLTGDSVVWGLSDTEAIVLPRTREDLWGAARYSWEGAKSVLTIVAGLDVQYQSWLNVLCDPLVFVDYAKKNRAVEVVAHLEGVHISVLEQRHQAACEAAVKRAIRIWNISDD